MDASGQASVIYRSIFDTAPSADAMAYLSWSLRIGVSLPDLTAWLAQLPEAAAPFERTHASDIWVRDLAGSAVVRAYDAMLDTVPDPASLLIWKSAVGYPGNLELLYATLMGTEMHTALYEGVSPQAWVAGHYEAALERPATAAELAHSTGLVVSGAVSYLGMALAIGELQPYVEPVRTATMISVELL